MGHGHAASVASAVILLLLLGSQAAVLSGLTVASRLSAARHVVWGLFTAAMGAAAFQVLHALEHVLQFGYWVGHPSEPPWMTPWAMVGMHAFADLGDPSPLALGTELLHLVGNSIFLVGVLTLALLVRILAPGSRAARTTRLTLYLQGFHVLEHVALTLSFVWVGKAMGLSTFCGLVDPGPLLWTYRVWWHFLINAVATIMLVRAIVRLWPHWRVARGLDGPFCGWLHPGREPRNTPAHAADRRLVAT